MVRKKVTVSLSSRCLQLIDQYSETTGFESRSRVIEEAVFAIEELLRHRVNYAMQYSQTFQAPKKNYSKAEIMKFLIGLSDLLSKFGALLDRFVRFANVSQKQTDTEKIYRYVPVQERNEPKE